MTINLSELRRAYNQGYEAVSGGLVMSVEAHESGLRAVDTAIREGIARQIEAHPHPGIYTDYAARIVRGEQP